MTVNVTKPALNIREKLAELDKPSGIAGEAMLRADSVQEQRNLLQVGRKNLIINGGFDVWQRGTAGVAENGFNMDAADRWYAVRGALSKEIENSVTYCHMVHGNYADSCYINHRVEDFAHTLGKQVTISYKIKSDDGLGADGGIFIRYYNSSNTYTTPLTSRTYVYGSDWTTITYTFTMPATTPKDGYGLEIFLYGDLNSVNNNGKSFDIKEVQLELGSVATDFEHRSFGEEFALCQRYYQRTYNYGTATGTATTDGALLHSMDGTQSYGKLYWQFKTSMRSNPTIVSYNTNNGTAGQLSADALNHATGFLLVGQSGAGIGVGGISIGTSTYLKAHATADAEL